METIRELTEGKRFNGKIYGKQGSFSIYINGEKAEVNDKQVEEYREYIRDFESLKESVPNVLDSRACELIAIENGIEHEFVELSFEQLKQKISLFQIEEIKKEKGAIIATLQVAKYKGEIVAVWAGNNKGAYFFANTPDQQSQLMSQFK